MTINNNISNCITPSTGGGYWTICVTCSGFGKHSCSCPNCTCNTICSSCSGTGKKWVANGGTWYWPNNYPSYPYVYTTPYHSTVSGTNINFA